MQTLGWSAMSQKRPFSAHYQNCTEASRQQTSDCDSLRTLGRAVPGATLFPKSNARGLGFIWALATSTANQSDDFGFVLNR